MQPTTARGNANTTARQQPAAAMHAASSKSVTLIVLTLDVDSKGVDHTYENEGATRITRIFFSRGLLTVGAVADTKTTSQAELHGKERHHFPTLLL
jgi:hypothetical protein